MTYPYSHYPKTVEIDGIYYNLVTWAKQAEVTRNPNEYRGAVNIPETVSYNGVTYSVTSIGDGAFRSSGLTSVTIGNSVKSIGNYAFYKCYNLTSVTIGNSVTSIGSGAFSDCSYLEKVIVPNIAAWCGIAFEDENANPLYRAHHLYSDETTEITNLIIPNSVTSIGYLAFRGCSGLTSVNIPNSVTSIGKSAFDGCSGLTSVTIPNSVKSIGYRAFYNCSGLKKVIVPDIAAWCSIDFADYYDADMWVNPFIDVDDYSANPLYYARHLYSDETTEITNLIIPNSVTSIGGYAFWNCRALTSVTIPNSVTSIGWRAFQDCSGLTSVTIPNSVKRIEWHAFRDCSGLTSVTIPNSVKSIGGIAFQDCSGLTSVTIPNSVTRIEWHAFDGCSGLTSVTIPNSVTSIQNDAFRYCLGLTSVTIPNSVTSIGDRAFAYCTGLTSVNIGNGVKSIGSSAFADCAELTDVYCYAESVPSTNSNAFDGSYTEYATLHVPAASIEKYKAKAPWSNFGTIVATDGTIPEPPTPEKCATPTISYSKGELTFSCNTEGAEFISEIKDADIKKHYTASVSLTATYNISVYATKANYENSDTIQATLCWIEQQPQTEGITDEDAVAEMQAVPVLIQTQGNTINVQGAEAGTEIILYGTNGVQLDSVIATTGVASLNASGLSGSVAIVKIGNKTVKVLIKQ